MLPFLKNKDRNQSQAGVIVKVRAPDSQDDKEMDQDDPDAAIHACASDLVNAIHARDTKQVAEIIKDMFELMDSEPHHEGPHLPEEEIE